MIKNCPDCGAILKKSDINKGKCWKCKSSSIQDVLEQEKIEQEKKFDEKSVDLKDSSNEVKIKTNIAKKNSNPPLNENQIKDYPALTFLSKATNLIAWLAVVMSIIWTLIYLSNVGQYASGAITFLTLIVTAIGAFMIFIFWKAISEVLIVLVDIAQDLRRIRIKE